MRAKSQVRSVMFAAIALATSAFAADATRFVVDPSSGKTLAELDSNGAVLAEYTWAPLPNGMWELISIRRRKADGTYTTENPIHDGLGSVRALTDTQGNTVGKRDYDPYGVPTFSEGLAAGDPFPSSYGYRGEHHDPNTGLIHLPRREYDPRTGRFIQMDPHPGFARHPQSLHKYVYAESNPVNKFDPTGLFSLSDLQASVDAQLVLVRQAFAVGGRQAGGRALRELGQVVEKGVEKLVKGCLKPGADIKKGKPLKRQSDGANAVIDFFVEMGSKVKNIEVKYQLPAGTSSGGFARASKQLQAMIDKGEEGLLIAYKEMKSDVRTKKMLNSVSDNASTVQVMEGFVNLGQFLGEMVIEGCIK